MLDEQLRDLFATAHTIAVLGAKDTPGRDVDRVGRYLIAAGYQILPVHPVRKNVWGLPTYANLGDIPVPVDIVNLFRASEFCPGHARETLVLSPFPRAFWMQVCIESPESVALLEPQGIAVVEDACIMVEHARLFERPLPENGESRQACALRSRKDP